MYTDRNFKTKKELKQAVALRLAYKQLEQAQQENERSLGRTPHAVTVYQPNGDLTGASVPTNGKVCLEGPHYPEPHRWYAEAWLEDGEVVRVK